LDARTVELPFEKRRAKVGERRGHVLGRLREHGEHRPHQADGESFESGPMERRMRDLRYSAGEGRGTSHLRGRQASGGGERLQHYAFERSLPQLAHDEAGEKVLLLRCSLRKEVPELL